ncbi:MAG: hypothetical protein ACXADY_13120 [Candidatus Hodarchaeales archaeon]|jgi:hypothetical protein
MCDWLLGNNTIYTHEGVFWFLTFHDTLQELKKWHMEFTQKNGKVPLMIFGNKVNQHDQRVVRYEEGKMMVQKFSADSVETSVFDNASVESGFTNSTWKIVGGVRSKFMENKVQKFRCGLCENVLSDNSVITMCPFCKNEFHLQCMTELLNETATCPVCKNEIIN